MLIELSSNGDPKEKVRQNTNFYVNTKLTGINIK